MAKLNSTYKATEENTEQRSEFDDLPAGIFDFELEASEVVETGEEHDRTGCGLKYTATVIGPDEVAGRKFFGFINLENRNAQAQEIGQKEFNALIRAIGEEGEVDDSEILHFRSYRVKLGMGKPSKKTNADGTPKYPARMEVKRYFFPDQGDMPDVGLDAQQPGKAANDNKPGARAPAARQAAAPAAAGEVKKRPWGGK